MSDRVTRAESRKRDHEEAERAAKARVVGISEDKAESIHNTVVDQLNAKHAAEQQQAAAAVDAEKQRADANEARLAELQRRFDEISQAHQAPSPSDNRSSSSMDVDGGARGRAPGASPSTSSMRSVGGRTVASGSIAAERMFAAFGEQCALDGDSDSDEGETDEWEELAGKASEPVTVKLVKETKAANAILTVNRTYERKCVNVDPKEFFLAGFYRDGEGEVAAYLFAGYHDELNDAFVITEERTYSKIRLLKVKGKYENCALKANSKEIALALRKENGVDTSSKPKSSSSKPKSSSSKKKVNHGSKLR